MSAVGCGVCAISCIAGIVISSIGLAGGCSLQTASIGSLATMANPISSIPQLVVGILGLTGSASMGVVSGVTLGASLLGFMVTSCVCGAAVMTSEEDELLN